MRILVTDCCHQQHIPLLLEEITQLCSGINDGNLSHLMKDGRRMDVEFTSRKLMLRGGELDLVVVRDISEEVRPKPLEDTAGMQAIEIQLRETQQRYREVVENAVFGIFQSTPDGRYLNANPAMAEMLGYASPQELIASIHDISEQVYVDPACRERFKKQVEQQGMVKNFECQAYRKDGSRIWLSATLRAVFKGGVVVEYHGMNEDITQRKLLEEQLQATQKMEALGHLSVGVAHEFNNVLNVITGYSELLQTNLPSGKEHRYAAEISKAGLRAAALTRQLLVFSRQQVIQPVLLDLNEAIREWHATMLPLLLNHKIHAHLKLSSDLAWVKIDLGQIGQILMNLAINARDAMPHGGQLTIETANVELDESYARSNKYLPPGSYVMLSFSDNGCGMDADTRARVFDPFFTTKVPGKGTGLGMSTVFGIVKQNSGYIVVESELNSGASFKIYFPPTQDHTLTDASPSRKKRVLPFGLTPCVANPSRPEIS